MRHHQCESHQSAKYCSGTGGQATQSNASRSAWMDVGVESHDHASRIDRKYSRAKPLARLPNSRRAR